MERMLAPALLLAGIMAASVTARAQEVPAAATTATPDAADDLAFLTEDDRMTVPVEIAGAGPFRFVIDTGAQRSVISRQLAARLGLPGGRRVRLTAMSGTSDVDTVVIPSLSVSSLGAQRVEAPALDAVHMGALGMLGIDTLQGQAVSIDFDAQRMAVVRAAARPRRRSGSGDEIVIRARSLFGQLVVTDAMVMGRNVRVVLDTGTSVSVGNLALKKLLTRRSGGFEPAVFTSVLGQQVVGEFVAVPEMTLGEATITGLPVAFADAAPFRAFGLADRPAVLLGMDALRLFRRVQIDFANRELRLTMPRGYVRRGLLSGVAPSR